MSVSLQKGQKVSLTKESREGLNKVIVGLGWDEAKPAGKGGLFGSLFSKPTQATATPRPSCCKTGVWRTAKT